MNDMLLDDSNLTLSVKKWVEGIEYELKFWNEWFFTKGMQWPDEYNRRVSSNLPFLIERFVEKKDFSILEVLDVGSGPISPLGTVSNNYIVNLTAVDPLASFYNNLYEKYSISPYVKTQFSFAESLVDKFEKMSFDVVHMGNALDHAYNPILCICNMLEVVKFEGQVILQHYENEAIHENYSGFHQWNISETNGNTVVYNNKYSFNLTEYFGDLCVINTVRDVGEQRDTIITSIKRVSETAYLKSNVYKSMFDRAILDLLYSRTYLS